MDLSDIRPLHRIAMVTSTNIVGSVQHADLNAATPCADWQLIDLLAHMTVQHRGFAAAARGFGSEPKVWDAASVRDAVAADPGAAYADAAKDVLAAFADDAVLDASFTLPDFGPDAKFPGSVAIGFHFVDYVVHGWDVAKALGMPFTVADEVVDAALPLALLAPEGEARDVPGAPFAHATDGPSQSSLDKILRYLGRDPSWAAASGQR
jgi:uncharacterized protein (TIGR03086 family)